jgi:Rad3-related DNA helicase
LHDVTLSIVPQLHHVYDAASGVVFTSATLTTGGNFAYIKDILGLQSVQELLLPSSFPLRDNLLIYLVDDAPDPRGEDFDAYIGNQMAAISRLLGGRTLGLFTSFKSVSAVFYLLIRALNKEQIKLYGQGHSGGKSTMLKRFRQNPRSVLLGTDSFWEGIDVPGDTLSCVVIPKLPFAPPHDPVTDAVSEERGVGSFESISLPTMILKLRQGVGRLIRRNEDRGVVVIFDSRLHHSRYGEAVIKSLPAGRIKIGSADDLPATIRAWIGKEVLERWDREA